MTNRALRTRKPVNLMADSGMSLFDTLEAAVEANGVIIADVSGSMAMKDAGESGKERRWDVLVRILKDVMEEMDGHLIVVAFSDEAQVVLHGDMPSPGSGTNMAGALDYAAKFATGGVKTVLISDGEPTSRPDDTLAAAARFPGKLSTICCGPIGGRGSAFMQKLAHKVGGKHQDCSLSKPVDLLAGIKKLLLADGR